ncbi:MAG: DUF167 domain-containing protein [archaeon]
MIDINAFIKNNTLEIIVKPNAKKNELLLENGRIKAAIKAPAEDNKANLEIIKFFSKLTGKKVRIISGITNRHKKLRFY